VKYGNFSLLIILNCARSWVPVEKAEVNLGFVIDLQSDRDFRTKIEQRFFQKNRSSSSRKKSIRDRKAISKPNPQTERKIGSRIFSKKNGLQFSEKNRFPNFFFQIDQRVFQKKHDPVFRSKLRLKRIQIDRIPEMNDIPNQPNQPNDSLAYTKTLRVPATLAPAFRFLQ